MSFEAFVIVILLLVIVIILIVNKDSNNNKITRETETTEVKVMSPEFSAVEKKEPVVAGNWTEMRDRSVLHDPLYPPLNRPPVHSGHTMNAYYTNVATRDSGDTYRLVGYMVGQEDRGDVWKLFARETHRGGRSEFYASNANRNVDIKVFLGRDVVKGTGGERLNDIYTIPDAVVVSHPMFAQGEVYQITQLPNSPPDF